MSFWTDLRALLDPGSTPDRPRWFQSSRPGSFWMCLRPFLPLLPKLRCRCRSGGSCQARPEFQLHRPSKKVPAQVQLELVGAGQDPGWHIDQLLGGGSGSVSISEREGALRPIAGGPQAADRGPQKVGRSLLALLLARAKRLVNALALHSSEGEYGAEAIHAGKVGARHTFLPGLPVLLRGRIHNLTAHDRRNSARTGPFPWEGGPGWPDRRGRGLQGCAHRQGCRGVAARFPPGPRLRGAAPCQLRFPKPGTDGFKVTLAGGQGG